MSAGQGTRPAAPPRQRWFVQADTWDRQLVVERCREWAHATGAPPRYYDWGPVQRARAAGCDASLARRWEREHPRWPSTAVVYRHVGSWRELLREAGFPAPDPIELPFSDRVREATRLRADGLTWGEVADLLGVARDTARRYARAHDCQRCGQPVLSAAAPLCRTCAHPHGSRWGKPFSEREIIGAVRAWKRLEGRSPAQSDWQPVDQGGHLRWERECPRWPPTSHVMRRFGSWNAALRAAGDDRPRAPSLPDAAILDALRAYADTNGAAPSSSDWCRLGLLPNRDTIARRFGSWNAALRAAGLSPRRIRADWSDEDILDGLRRFAKDHGRAPRAADRVGQLAQYPGPTLVISRFGSWSAALRKAGLEPGNPAPATAEQIIRALRAYNGDHGVTPTAGDWRRDHCTPGVHAVYSAFGSWTPAVQAAGLAPHWIRVERSDEQILEGLRQFAKDHGRPPRQDERVGWRSRYPSPTLVRSRFGSWSAALSKAGLQPGRS